MCYRLHNNMSNRSNIINNLIYIQTLQVCFFKTSLSPKNFLYFCRLIMFYLIFGETPVKRKLILLNISGYEYVGELRKGIYKDYNTFDNIKENDLRLWKVN